MVSRFTVPVWRTLPMTARTVAGANLAAAAMSPTLYQK
jgi:hypothetical protein